MNRIIVIGCSAGCGKLLDKIIENLSLDYPFPLIIVRHRAQDNEEISITELLSEKFHRVIREPLDKEQIKSGVIYFAPPSYHLLVEKMGTFSLSIEGKINYSRPSIDLLFQSVGEAFKEKVVGIVLSGANNDGAEGLKVISQNGGTTIVQSPENAEFPEMPRAAIDICDVDYVMDSHEIIRFLKKLEGIKNEK